MRSAAFIRHVAFEGPGLLSAVLREAGYAISLHEATTGNLSDPALDNADLLVVLGGPIGAYETGTFPFLAAETALLARRLAADRPTLGICLGAQLMASALGARVFPGRVKEIGWGSVALTEEGRRSCLAPLDEPEAAVLHWHGDTFDLPEGAVRLASTTAYDNQAFAWGRSGLALQFHAEADPPQLEDWYVGHAFELAAAGVAVPRLRAAAAAATPRAMQQARRIFGEWLRHLR